VTVKAVNDYTSELITGADVYLDGSIVCKTGQDGACIIKNIIKGSHNFEVIYKQNNQDYSSSKIPKDVSSTSSLEIRVRSPIEVNLLVKDELTSTPVDNTEVFLNDKSFGTTSQDGTLRLKGIIPGTYDFSIVVPNYGKLPVKSLSITNQPITATVDMPRPNLKVTVVKEESYWPYCTALKTCLRCIVTATNIGKITASNPVAICAMYEISNGTTKPIGYTQVQLGPLAPDASNSQRSEDSVDYNYFSTTDKEIAVVVFDNDKYVPSLQTKLNLELGGNLAGKVMEGLASFCSSNPDVCIKAVGVVASGLGG
jgi:hypothetical protein